MRKGQTGKGIPHHVSLPYLGYRIIKTSIAVFLCLLLHMLLGYQGMVLQSVIAAIVCMQPYVSDTKKFAVERMIGTINGAVWGLLFLFFFSLFPGLPSHMLLAYFFMSVGVLITIYSTVVLRLTDTAGLSAIVFMCVVISYPELEAPVLLALSRIWDTTIGILVAIAVNVVKLPRKRRRDWLFFVRLQDLVPDRYAQVASRVMISLNHLYQDGARICLVSQWAPAYTLSQMEHLEAKVPAIVMDGAALYDFYEKKYLEIIEMGKEDAALLCRMLKKMNLGYCVYAVRDRTTLIYRQGQLNRAEAMEYDKMKRSLLRNYVDGPYTGEDRIAFIRTIDTEERIDALELQLKTMLPKGHYRMVKRPQPDFAGYAGLYFYAPGATVEQMKRRIVQWGGGAWKPVDVLPEGTHYDVQKDAIHLLHRLRALYEPLFFVS